MRVFQWLSPLRTFGISLCLFIAGNILIRYKISRSHNSIVDFAITAIVLRSVCVLCIPILGLGVYAAYREMNARPGHTTTAVLKILLNMIPLTALVWLFTALP